MFFLKASIKKWHLFLIPFSIFLTTYSQSVAAPLSLSYSDGLLTLRCRNVELKDVLKEISIKTGVHVKLGGATSGLISKDIHRVPLERALHEILRGKNYLLVTGKTPEGDESLSIIMPGEGSSTTYGGLGRSAPKTKRASPGNALLEKPSASAIDNGVTRRRVSIIQKRISALRKKIEIESKGKANQKFISALRERVARLQNELDKLEH
ncbi:MAG: hypothetical protein ACE5FU_06035 [Nitrospinota bacterium]